MRPSETSHDLAAPRRLARAVLAWATALAGLVIALPIALISLSLFAIAAGVQGLARALAHKGLDWPQAFDFDGEIGWKLKPHLDCRVGPEAFRITTDAEGWRGRDTTVDEAEVVVIGDSFAFGHCIDERAFFASLARGVRVKGIGAPGYSMVSGLLWMERLQPRLAGKTIVWLVYLGNDLDDNLRPDMRGYRSPFVREIPGEGGRWEIVTSHLDPSTWPFETRGTNYEAVVEICCSTFLTERVFSACGWMIGEARGICAEAGGRLVVMTVPDLSRMVQKQFANALARRPDAERYDPRLPDRRLGEICRQAGVEFVALADHLEEGDYLTYDVHWNERGHRKVASLLETLQAQGRPGLVAERERRVLPLRKAISVQR